MRGLVVYESMYGNTRTIAEAVAEGLSSAMDVDTVEVGVAPTEIDPGVTLVVAGGPTHAFGMSNAGTRESATERHDKPLVSTGHGLREWLSDVELPSGTAIAVFDTRIDRPRWFWGSAARAAGRWLRRRGIRLLAPPENFYVAGPRGPVEDALLVGETDRARRWGEQLAARCRRTTGDRETS